MPSANADFGFVQRGIQSLTEPNIQLKEEVAKHEDEKSNLNSNSDRVASQMSSTAASMKISPRHDLAMIFTCKVCNTRSMKTCSRESYEKGVVVVRCANCNNLHLIADRLGMFGKPGSVEDFLAARGEEVKKGSTEALNLTLEDLAGSEAFKDKDC